jgi:hypothetical protein
MATLEGTLSTTENVGIAPARSARPQASLMSLPRSVSR